MWSSFKSNRNSPLQQILVRKAPHYMTRGAILTSQRAEISISVLYLKFAKLEVFETKMRRRKFVDKRGSSRDKENITE
jgi:hypothetical protein